MSDEDMIRRGDVLAKIKEYLADTGSELESWDIEQVISAIPAAQPSPDVAGLLAALDRTTAHGQRAEHSHIGHALSEASWYVHLAGFRCSDDADAFLNAALARLKGGAA